MRKDHETLWGRVLDAASGYTVLVLSIVCFVIAMTIVIAVVRLLGGVA